MKLWIVAALTVVAGAAFAASSGATAAQEQATVQVRVWNSVADSEDFYISARPEGGSWGTLGTMALPLDSETANGRFRYGDIAVDVPLEGRDTIRVDVRVWQSTRNDSVHISARPEGSSWGEFGTVPLALDSETENGRWNYGDISLSVVPPPPLPQVVSLTFFGDFTEDQRVSYEASVREELESVARFFRVRHGVVTPDLAFAYTASAVPRRGYRDGTIYLRLGYYDNRLATEYIHALQDTVRAGTADNSPLWIREGMAWYLDAVHDRAVSEEPFWVFDREHLWWQARKPDSVTLRDMESGPWRYGLGYLAIEQLVERTSEAALFDFYRNLRTDTPWQEAFEETFGMTVDAYYQEFEEWRAREAPPLSWFEGMVVDPDGNPVQGISVGALKSVPGDYDSHSPDAWTVKSSTTGPKGIFRMPAEPSEETVLRIGTDKCGDVGLLSVDGTITRDPDQARRFHIELEGISGIKLTLYGPPETLCTPETAYRWYSRRAMGYGY